MADMDAAFQSFLQGESVRRQGTDFTALMSDEILRGYLEQSGYTYITFDSLMDRNIEIQNISFDESNNTGEIPRLLLPNP